MREWKRLPLCGCSLTCKIFPVAPLGFIPMSYLDPGQRRAIYAQITTKQAQLVAANTAYLSALGNSEIQGYSFSSGEGDQKANRRKPEEIRNEIAYLESDLCRLYRQINGKGIVNMNLRRRH